MILVDTSVWIDHLRRSEDLLIDLLAQEQVVMHPFVIGELALGSLRSRSAVLETLQDLRQATVAQDDEVMRMIDRHGLFGLGIGYVDVHLLAAVRLTPDASLWTRDKRLLAVAERLSLAARLTH
jgi:predicted nucleic acid-binding protein